MTSLDGVLGDWLLLLKPDLPCRTGHVQHVLLDFDGTLSLLREGWEAVMIPMMLEMICPDRPAPVEIEQEVRRYVDRSTGTLTIRQMEWLAQAVKRYGVAEQPLKSQDYKAIYVQRVLRIVQARMAEVDAGLKRRQDFLVSGASVFIELLVERGTRLYLASGTDHQDVVREASYLGIARFFEDRIYGALDETEAHDKALIIQRILAQASLKGDELLVAGDGPVEISLAAENGALALGVATDETARQGWNQHKARRLQAAGADALVPDFSRAERLVDFLFRRV